MKRALLKAPTCLAVFFTWIFLIQAFVWIIVVPLRTIWVVNFVLLYIIYHLLVLGFAFSQKRIYANVCANELELRKAYIVIAQNYTKEPGIEAIAHVDANKLKIIYIIPDPFGAIDGQALFTIKLPCSASWSRGRSCATPRAWSQCRNTKCGSINAIDKRGVKWLWCRCSAVD